MPKKVTKNTKPAAQPAPDNQPQSGPGAEAAGITTPTLPPELASASLFTEVEPPQKLLARPRVRTIDAFQEHFGMEFYLFINSDCGQALLDVLEANSPAVKLAELPAEQVAVLGTVYAANIQSWMSCIQVLREKLVPTNEFEPSGGANYEHELEGLDE